MITPAFSHIVNSITRQVTDEPRSAGPAADAVERRENRFAAILDGSD